MSKKKYFDPNFTEFDIICYKCCECIEKLILRHRISFRNTILPQKDIFKIVHRLLRKSGHFLIKEETGILNTLIFSLVDYRWQNVIPRRINES